uniref:NADH dehydrogenase subunit 2 n=1 Tax=Nigidius sinicus TaxID=2950530 RepID=UPI0021151959|nr:NADH dehydrogenase subunit 2 [Nigidius sinicus]USR68896.1 NADH dehydrogenase subunit 2 [Nigidius sinicus]
MWHLNKIMFSTSLMMGTLIAISSYSWMGMWIGLEINLLSFIPLIKSKNNIFSSEAALKYFIVQAIASTILLFSIILLSLISMYLIEFKSPLTMILNSSLLLKMGSAPFHFWFPEVMEGLTWSSSLTLLTWQKIAPMILFIYLNKNIMFISIIIISCMLISGIMGQNQLSLRKIMAYSSINHIGWMIASSLMSESIWTFYFIIYSIISINIIMMFKTLNIFYFKQMIISSTKNTSLKLFLILNFLSLGGLPPFLGFFPKWLTIQAMTEKNMLTLATLMIILTLMTLYFYMQLTFTSTTLSTSLIIYNLNNLESKFLILSSNLITLLSLIILTLIFNYM